MSQDNMVQIPDGGFEMGDHLDNIEDALPVHTVELDSLLYGCTSGDGGAVQAVCKRKWVQLHA